MTFANSVLLSIEEELGDKAKFAGKDYRHPKINWAFSYVCLVLKVIKLSRKRLPRISVPVDF